MLFHGNSAGIPQPGTIPDDREGQVRVPPHVNLLHLDHFRLHSQHILVGLFGTHPGDTHDFHRLYANDCKSAHRYRTNLAHDRTNCLDKHFSSNSARWRRLQLKPMRSRANKGMRAILSNTKISSYFGRIVSHLPDLHGCPVLDHGSGEERIGLGQSYS